MHNVKRHALQTAAILGATCAHAQYTVLHSFLLNDPGNGAYPAGAVISDTGGTNNTGVLYSIRTNGGAP
jgi:hypothetical protein